MAKAHEYPGEAYAEMGRYDLAKKGLKILRELMFYEAGEPDAFIFKMRIISKRVGVILRIQGSKDSRIQVKYFEISMP